MYKAFEKRTLLDMIEENTIYRCKKDVVCGDGVFEAGTFVILGADSYTNAVYVSDLGIMCQDMIKKRNYNFYKPQSVGVVADKIYLSPDDFDDYFEKSEEVSDEWEKFRYKGWSLSDGLVEFVFIFGAAFVYLALAVGNTAAMLLIALGCACAITLLLLVAYACYSWHKAFKQVSVFLVKYANIEGEGNCRLKEKRVKDC